jgi:hypothetical protein
VYKKKKDMIPKIHGYYQWSNACGYGVHLSDDGEQAKLIMNDEDCTTTEWLDVEFILDEEINEWVPVIDPTHYNVPLNLVMRAY